MITFAEKRSPARRVVVFNHKGGVGKTTLTFNIACALVEKGYSVLLVDADPQCNLTSHALRDKVVDGLLDDSDSPQGRTLWSALKPVYDGTGPPLAIKPFVLRGKGPWLIPGDIQMSSFEDELLGYWAGAAQRQSRGLRGTVAISAVVNAVARRTKADFVFYDVGPNIGALNRVAVLDCDHFVVPVACDLFSLRALKTLGRRMVVWMQEWRTIAQISPRSSYLLPGRPSLLGYVPGGYRVYGGTIAKKHADFLERIERRVQSEIVNVIRSFDPTVITGRQASFRLGEVKNFGDLVVTAQLQRVPLFDVADISDSERRSAWQAFADIAEKIIVKVGYGHSGK